MVVPEPELFLGQGLGVDDGVLQAGHDPDVEEVEIPGGKNAPTEFKLDAGSPEVLGRLGHVGRLLDLLPHDDAVIRVEGGAVVQRLLAGVAFLHRREMLVHVTL